MKPTHRIAVNPAKNIFLACTVLAVRDAWTRVRIAETGRVYWTPQLVLALAG